MNQSQPQYRVVVFERDGAFIAQFLEFALATQADSLADLPMRIFMLLNTEVKFANRAGQEPFVRHRKAAKVYFDMWEKGTPLFAAHYEQPLPEAFLADRFAMRRVAVAA